MERAAQAPTAPRARNVDQEHQFQQRSMHATCVTQRHDFGGLGSALFLLRARPFVQCILVLVSSLLRLLVYQKPRRKMKEKQKKKTINTRPNGSTSPPLFTDTVLGDRQGEHEAVKSGCTVPPPAHPLLTTSDNPPSVEPLVLSFKEA
ncbi:hypothetical protein F2P81_017304 [Scophthalmus maximus]|uniref:Transmembrane protein n=1 Tax=Scophthalmus maximus TaxID=52904 RepID=A0A6A4S896_SCOMX|nr:hypothetical protein F2P81_017304 [Scophthalmus maximus]